MQSNIFRRKAAGPAGSFREGMAKEQQRSARISKEMTKNSIRILNTGNEKTG